MRFQPIIVPSPSARAIGRELGLQSVEHFLGKAARIGAVFTISGGIALIRAAFATRLSPG
jgi:hypothetical protein